MSKIISLNPNEGVASIVDRIINTSAQQIFLLLPSENDLLNDYFSLNLLKREIKKSKKELVLVLPTKINFDLNLIKRMKFEIISRDDLRQLTYQFQEDEIKKDEIKNENKEKKETLFQKNNINEINSQKINIFTPKKEIKLFDSSKKFLFGWGILSCLALLMVIYLFLGKATIRVLPRKDVLVFQKDIIASENINQVMSFSGQIPAKIFSLSKITRDKFLASGEKEIKKKAKGEIVIYNRYSSRSQPLVATTRFETKDGKIFRLIKPTIIPGAKVENGKIIANSTKALVEADQPGSNYNIQPTDFTIPGFKGSSKYKGFYAKSFQSMKGGEITKVKVVTTKDIQQAFGKLKKNFSDNSSKMKEDILQEIPNDYKILNNKANYTRGEIICSAKAGDETDQFDCHQKETIEVIAFKENDLFTLFEKINQDFLKEKIILKNQSKIDYSMIIYDFKHHQVSFNIKVNLVAASKINQDKLRNDLLGKTKEQVRQIIIKNYPEIERIEVNFWPIWIQKVPENTKRVKIEQL